MYIIAKVEELCLHHPGWRGQGGAGGVCDENGSAGQMLSRLNVTSLDFTGHPPIKHSIQHSTGRLKSVKCLETVKFLHIQLPCGVGVMVLVKTSGKLLGKL